MNSVVLPVLLPLLAAPTIVMLQQRRGAWWLALLAALTASGMVLWLTALGGGSTQLGGWAPPVGIILNLDGANLPVLLLVCVAGTLALIAAPPERLAYFKPPQLALFYALFCLAIAGLAGITATGDAFNVFVFLEISSLATYALVASGPRREALRSAFQYLMLGTIGGSFVLLGIGLLYAATGSLNMQDIAERLVDNQWQSAILAGAIFLLLGFALKSAMFPLHQWLPGVYAESPSPVAAFLAASGTKVSLYALARFGFGVLGIAWLQTNHVDTALMILACAGMLFGSATAFRQTRLRSLLAWSSVAHIGYLLLGLSLLSGAGIQAFYFTMLAHAIIKGGLFFAAGALSDDRLDKLTGLGQRDPFLATMITICALALLGVPLTAGFIGKWLLLSAALDAQAWLGVISLAVSSALAVIYCGRIVLPLWQAGEDSAETARCLSARVPVALCAGAALVFGCYPTPLLNLARAAARVLVPA